MILHLHLKFEYFDAIQRGEKLEEYRLAAKWQTKLDAKPYTEVWLYRGFQKVEEGKTLLKRPYQGYQIKELTHPHFGQQPMLVCAIPVVEPEWWLGKEVSMSEAGGWIEGEKGIVERDDNRSLSEGWFHLRKPDGSVWLAHFQEAYFPA